MHWVALYLAFSIKSSASKTPSRYRSHSAYIPETPLLGAEVILHCPCQVADVSKDFPVPPPLLRQAPMVPRVLITTA